jgi:LPS-assembly lipoprotein
MAAGATRGRDASPAKPAHPPTVDRRTVSPEASGALVVRPGITPSHRHWGSARRVGVPVSCESEGLRFDGSEPIRSPSKPLRHAFLALPLLALAACGFTPAYGPQGEARALRGTIVAAEPDTDIAFAFVRRLEERLGRPDAPRLTLAYDLDTDSEGLAIDGANNITRFRINGRLTWTLVDGATETARLSGEEIAFTAYSATGSTISTLESERDAERRLAILLADRVVARLLVEAP